MEYDVEHLIEDLSLPREVIEQDVASGRLQIYQHNEDPRYYVDHDVFVDYLTARVVELGKDQKKIFWNAVRKIITSHAEGRLSPEELRAVLQAVEREIARCGQ